MGVSFKSTTENIDACRPFGRVTRLILRSRYPRWIGDFVLHRHIIDHEDHGVMQNIRIGHARDLRFD